MNEKIKIKKGDQVKVIAGNSKGKEGKVLEVIPDKNKAIVEGINLVSKHTKPNSKYPKGGVIKKESTIHISNLMLIDSDGNATRIGIKEDKNQNKVRYSKKTGEVIK
ncbi:MAG: 50S ribosomal protein L24 [Bacteroidales bacterium]|nr:50S ribosomal protein L24 [Bacteroidales bacterium]